MAYGIGFEYDSVADTCTVTYVADGSSAADKGVMVGDIITALDSRPMNSALSRCVAAAKLL